MNFETIFKEKIELEKLVVALTRENMELKQRYNCNSEDNQLFADLLLKWLEKKKSQVRANTYDGYRSQINKHIEPYFRANNLHLSEITPIVIEDYYRVKQRQGLSGNTLAKHHNSIHAALGIAVRNRWITYNPADYTEKPGIEKFCGSFLTINELQRLFKHLEGHKLYLPVVLAAVLGLRRSEALALRWKDINWDSKTVCIQHTVVKYSEHHRNKLFFSNLTKNDSSHRTLPIPEKLFDYLQKVKIKQCKLYIRNRKVYNKQYLEYICVDEFGNFITPDYVSKKFKIHTDRLKLKCRYHDLRHTCASLLYQNGTQMKAVSQWLGHSSTAVTDSVYIHLSFKDKQNIADTLNDMIDL